MFENLKEKIKDRYQLFWARRYAKGFINQSTSTGLSLDVVPEEIKYKILKEGLIEDKEIVYSLIMNLTEKEQRMEMMKKYITSDNFPSVENLRDVPDALKIELLNNKIGYYNNKPEALREILNDFSDENFVRLLENNEISIKTLLSLKKEIYLESGKFPKVEDYWESIVYSRINNIKDKNLIDRIDKVLPVKELESRIDEKIFSVLECGYNEKKCNEYFYENLKNTTSDKLKIEYLLKQNERDKLFNDIYDTLSEESKKIILDDMFANEKINEYVKNMQNSYYRNASQYFGKYLVDYFSYAEKDFEVIKKLAYVTGENTSDRKFLLGIINDSQKKELIDDDKNYFENLETRIEHIFLIKDRNILINEICSQANRLNNIEFGKAEYFYDYMINKFDEKLVFDIIQNEINEGENVNLRLFLKLFEKITDKNQIKQILKNDFNKQHYEEKTKQNGEKNIAKIHQLIATKILEYDLIDEILEEIDINTFSDENTFLLLLNASKENRNKILEENPELEEIIITINKNEDLVKKLADGTKDITNELIFYSKILDEIRDASENEKSYSLEEKLQILVHFQEKNYDVAETINFDFIDKNIINEFGSIDSIERLTRYPKTQKQILNMKKDDLKVINFVTEYLLEKLPNADYVFNEILEEYNEQSEIYSCVKEYINSHENIDENVKDNIFNIITNLANYQRMFIELDKNITSEDIENINEIKDEFCDKVIYGYRGKTRFSVKDAYLMKYYNLTEKEAVNKVKEYMEFIESLDNTPENLELKKYIYALNNVLESNENILVAAYDLSKKETPISRIEIEKIEAGIKNKIVQELKDSLYEPENNETIGKFEITLDDGQKEVEVYEAKDEFNMLVTVLDAYGGGNGVYDNYKEQWNTNKFAKNQRICTSYIGNNSLSTAKRNNCVIYGFKDFSNSSLVKMAPYDIVSKNDTLVTTTVRDSVCMGPKELINKTRRYNELDIERTGEDGKKIQPNYIVCFANTMDEVNEESKRAAAQFNIPIVLINREKIAEQEVKKVEDKLQDFINTKDETKIDSIIEDFCNNKYSSITTGKDQKEADENNTYNEIVHIDKLYFSDEKLIEIFKTIADVAEKEKANGNEEKADQIISSLRAAVSKETEKHYLYQKQIYGVTESPFHKEVYDEVRDIIWGSSNERQNVRKEEAYQKIEFISQFDGNKNSVEINKRKKDFRDDAYDMSTVQQKIKDFTIEELEIVCSDSYSDKTLTNMYAVLLAKENGLDFKHTEMIVNCFRDRTWEKEVFEKYTEEELEIMKNLDRLKTERHDFSQIINIIQNPMEKRLKEDEEITNGIYEEMINMGLVDDKEKTLDEKIECIASCNPNELYDIANKKYYEFCYTDEGKSERFRKISTCAYVHGLDSYKCLEKMNSEEQKMFCDMAKIVMDSFYLGNRANETEKNNYQPKMFLEESEKLLPSTIQIQEAFANRMIDSIIDKEGYSDIGEQIKEKISKGRSPIDYAYGLKRNVAKKFIEENGNNDGR